MSTTYENIEVVKKMILDTHQTTIREVTDDFGISFGSFQAIFTEVLGIKTCGNDDCFKIAIF